MNECVICDIRFKSKEEKNRHMNGHYQYQSTDNILVKQYTGKKKEIKDDPMICLEHQCVITKQGCRGSENCGILTKDLYMEIEDQDITILVTKLGIESSQVKEKLIEKIGMDKIIDVSITSVVDCMLKVVAKLDVGYRNLNVYMRLSEFKKSIRNNDGIEINGKFYQMLENRTIDVEGRIIIVKSF